jgi:hypothetical protein
MTKVIVRRPLRIFDCCGINVSVNKSQATKILFGGIDNLIRNSPYFRDSMGFPLFYCTRLRPLAEDAHPAGGKGHQDALWSG